MKLLVRILNKFGFLKFFNLSVKILVNQKIFNIPIIGILGLSNFKITEPWMTKVLDVIISLKPKGAYLDIGVNIGQTLIKLKSVNSSIQYYGFEPNPVCIYYTKKLIEINNFENVILFPCGLSNSNSLYELSFFSESDDDSSASMVENFRPSQKVYKKENIPCYTVEEVFVKREMPKFSIIKIDVEGGELEVLEGLEKVIIKDGPYIQIEVLPVYENTNIQRLKRQNRIESLLKKWNYSIFRIHTNDKSELIFIELIESIGIHSNLGWCEYLFVPTSETQELQSAF